MVHQQGDEDALQWITSVPRKHTKTNTMPKMPRRQRQGSIDQGDDAPFQPTRTIDTTRIVEVGAFPVAGIGGMSSSIASTSSLGHIDTRRTVSLTQESSTVFPVLYAHVVDEESPSFPVGPLVEALPMDEFDPTELRHHRDTLFKSRKCRFISALTFLLVIGLIVAVVLLLTQNSSKAATSSDPLSVNNETQPGTNETRAGNSNAQAGKNESQANNNETQAGDNKNDTQAGNDFLSQLTPLLSNKSLTALKKPDSPQSLSLQWLLEGSNFREWPFHRQVQRYAMATIYYATGGPTWNNGGGNWLTNETECKWFQCYEGDFCNEDGKLQSLCQGNNTLIGKIPDEIRYLSSLEYIDLRENQLVGTIPFGSMRNFTSIRVLALARNSFAGTLTTSIGNFNALTVIDLGSNPLSNWALPSEIGQLTKLTYLDLSHTKITKTIPSELGLLTALQFLHLGNNDITGTIPTQIFACTSLSSAVFQNNSLSGTVASEFGSLTALTALYLDFNSFTGTVPLELGLLTAMTQLSLGLDTFTGKLPAEFCDQRDPNLPPIVIFTDLCCCEK